MVIVAAITFKKKGLNLFICSHEDLTFTVTHGYKVKLRGCQATDTQLMVRVANIQVRIASEVEFALPHNLLRIFQPRKLKKRD